MGVAGSVLNNEEQLLDGAVKEYQKDPKRFEAFIAKVRQEASIRPPEVSAVQPKANEDGKDAAVEVTDVSAEICAELSLVRANPAAYCEYLEEHRHLLASNDTPDKVYKSRDGTLIRTEEGIVAVDEAIQALRETEPLPALAPSDFLFLAAKDHVADMAKTGILGHTGSDGSTTKDRIERHCVWVGSIGENIDYGNNLARDIVCHLIVDDGVPSRGHRKNILNAAFVFVGASLGHHPKYSWSCVMNFAGGVKDPASVLQNDATLTANSYEEMHIFDKALNSIPGGDVNTLTQHIQEELQRGAKVTMLFKPSESECVLEYADAQAIRTVRMRWGAK
jgi:uncharacterized protein YkwD